MAICPEQKKFVFEFQGKCRIQTCQHCTDKTANGCLSLDRKESSDRPITVSELQYFKGTMHQRFGDMNKKASEGYVRNTVLRIKDLTSLYLYMAWLDEHISPNLRKDMVLNDVLNSFYVKIVQHLPEFRVWMLPYVFSKKYRKQFYGSDGRKYNIQNLNIGTALDIHVKRLSTILEAVRNATYQ